jgi:hypothetical protein
MIIRRPEDDEVWGVPPVAGVGYIPLPRLDNPDNIEIGDSEFNPGPKKQTFPVPETGVGAPVDFGGRVIPYNGDVVPRLDTEGANPDPHTIDAQMRYVGRPEQSPAPVAAPSSSSNAAPVTAQAMPQSPVMTRDLARAEELGRGSGLDQFSKNHHILGPILRGLDIAGSVLAPNVAVQIPGTTLHHQMLTETNRNNLEQDIAQQQHQAAIANQIAETGAIPSQIAEREAQTSKANAEVAAMPDRQRLEQAQAEAANYKDDPNLGLIDLRTGKPVSSTGSAPLTKDEATVLGKQEGELVPLKLKNTANEIVNRGIATVPGESDTYLVNKTTGEKRAVGVGSPRAVFAPANKIIEVADPDNPGQTKYVRAGEALTSGAAGTKSASFQVPKDILKWATSGKGGEEINAFNTALQHADLLEQALTALNNGDVKVLNSLKNRFKTEFGSSDVTNFQTIANAYSREITKMLSSGHMTDAEIGSAGGTLPANASPEQIMGALDAYRALAASKMTMRYNQVQRGLQAQPNFPEGIGGEANPPKDADPGMKWQHRTINGKIEWRQVPK